MSTRLPSDQQQRDQAIELDNHVLLKAPAGSGKTGTLSFRLLSALSVSRKPEEVLALTFTNKATAEMKTRIIEYLKLARDYETPPDDPHQRQAWTLGRAVLARDAEEGWSLIENPSRLNISTFDAFNNLLASKLPLLSRLGGPANIEEHGHLLYRDAIRSLMQEMDSPKTDETVKAAIASLLRFAGNQIDRLMPKLVSLLACREQWLDAINNEDTFAMETALRALVAYRLEAARDALHQLGIEQELMDLMQEAAANQADIAIAEHWTGLPGADESALAMWQGLADLFLTQSGGAGGNGSLRKKVDKRCGFEAKKPHTQVMKDLLERLHGAGQGAAIEKALGAVRTLPSTAYPEEMETFREHIAIGLTRLTAHLQVVFEQAGALDYTEVAQRAMLALGSEGDVTELLMRLDYAIKHILVDEFQDTNVSQLKLLEKLTESWVPGDGRSLFMVGDPQQSIYRFRQAEVRIFDNLWQAGTFGDLPLACIELHENFRSDSTIVEFNNQVFARVFPDKVDPYVGAVTFTHSVPFDQKGEGAVTCHPVHGRNDAGEAERVAEICEDLQESYPGESVGILVRSRSHLTRILEVFKQRQIAYCASDIDAIVERTAAKNVVHLIRALRHPMDEIAWVGLLRARFVGLLWADILAIKQLAQRHNATIQDVLRLADLGDHLSDDGLSRIGQLINVLSQVGEDPLQVNHFPAKARAVWLGLGGEQVCSVAELADINVLWAKLDEYCPSGSLKEYNRFVASLEGIYATAEPAAINIMTVHAAKGLEFDHVVLPGLGRTPPPMENELISYHAMPEGFVIAPNPGRHVPQDDERWRLYNAMKSLENEAVQNEVARLLYVALTRARKTLHMTGHVLGEKNPAPPARSLLAMLWPAVEEVFSAGKPVFPVQADADEGGVDGVEAIPMIRRLPSGVQRVSSGFSFVPKSDSTHLPSELAVSDKYDENEREEGGVNRILGTVYHRIIENLSKDPAASSRVGTSMFSRYIENLLRDRGVSTEDLGESVSTISQLVNNTLSCPVGQWLMAPHEVAYSEWKVTGYDQGRWVAAVIDRAIKVDGVLYIVDYKTAGGEVSLNQIEGFIQAQADKYRPQMEDYKSLLEKHGETDVKIALYFPALQRAHVYDGETLPVGGISEQQTLSAR